MAKKKSAASEKPQPVGGGDGAREPAKARRAPAGRQAAATRAAEPAGYVPRMRTRYREEVVPKLMQEFGITNPMAVPRLEKISSTWGWARPRATSRSSTRRSRS